MGDGSILIPLLVGAAADGRQGIQKTSVEIAFLSDHQPLGTKGRLVVSPPKLDVPISTFLMDIQLPDSYEVKVTGAMKQVNQFSYPKPRPVNNDKGTDIVPNTFNFATMSQEVKRTGVNVQVPQTGNSHRFERLLVVEDGAEMTVDYDTPTAELAAEESTWRIFNLLKCGRRQRAQI